MEEQLVLGVRSSHSALVERLRNFSDAEAAAPSMLAGWTRGMLVAHVNSAGLAAMRCVAAAAAGDTISMYGGGDAQRDAEIESGRHAAATTLVEELGDVCRRLDDALARLPGDAWETPMLSRRGPIPIRAVVVQRWIDVEAHHVDLALGYSTEDWPKHFVDVAVPATLQVFPALRLRPDADRGITATWRIGRQDAPGEWTLRADADNADLIGSPSVDCEIRGSGATLLAILLGRSPAAPPTVIGDENLADALKRAFPGP